MWGFKAALLSALLSLTGCVASMAASAVGMAVSGAQGRAQSNEVMKPQAVKACSERASQFGAVHIIDVEQRTASKLIVWGTVDGQDARRSFQCSFGTSIFDFRIHILSKRN